MTLITIAPSVTIRIPSAWTYWTACGYAFRRHAGVIQSRLPGCPWYAVAETRIQELAA